MAAGEPTTNQRKNLDKVITPNNNMKRCFCERSGARCQGKKTRGPWTSQEKKDHIYVLESRKVNYAILTFLFASQSSINTYLNGRKWDRWCGRRKIDSNRCLMRDVVQF